MGVIRNFIRPGTDSNDVINKSTGSPPPFSPVPTEKMDDPYYKYASLSRDPRSSAFPGYLPSEGSAQTDPRSSAFPSYLTSEVSALAPRHFLDASNLRTAAEFPQSEMLSSRSRYGVDDLAGIGNHVSPATGGLAAGASMRAFTPLEDPALLRRDVVLAVKPGAIDYERSEPLRKSEGLLADESNMLFVDGLPNDCTRREVAHLFRPFIGFKEIRLVHKEARRSGDKAYVLCFVEFNDSKCALTALEALQGYMFDEKKPDTSVLRIQFAKFPFHPPNR